MVWKLSKSPIGMLQEDMWPDVWKILVVCILHNQTTRRQVDKVYKTLFKKYPQPKNMALADPVELAEILKPLGLYNRRSKSLVRFSKEFLNNEWNLPSDLYACGKYADDCYKVFCKFDWNNVTPDDNALNDYVEWARSEYA
tara:strand:- start:11311 stop:11733 length:423 start_codon:yes stop_codon:yes gene_type:complete